MGVEWTACEHVFNAGEAAETMPEAEFLLQCVGKMAVLQSSSVPITVVFCHDSKLHSDFQVHL